MNFNQQIFSEYREKKTKKLGSVWHENFSTLRLFLQHHTIDEIYKEPALYSWCIQQRTNFRNGVLPLQTVSDLQELGFVWDIKMYHWDQDFKALKNHRLEHGDFPRINIHQKESAESMLGYFIQKVRRSNKKNELNSFQLEKLNSLPGFLFEVGDSSWMKRAEKIKSRLAGVTRGSLRSVLGDDNDYNWVIRHKEILQEEDHSLSPEKREMLGTMGLFRFDAPTWEESFTQARLCFNKHGKVTKKADKTAYEWLIAQRRAFIKDRLSIEQIGKIESLSFDLHANGKEYDTQRWLTLYKEYQNFIIEHGRAPGLVSAPQIYSWVQNNRQVKAGTAKRRKPLEPWKEKMLADINFDFSQQEIFRRTWNENYHLLVGYLMENTSYRMASNDKPEVRRLYVWINNQLRKFREHRLAPGYILRFQEAGMDLSLDRLKLILESFHKPVEYGKSDLIRKLSELDTTNQESMSIRRMEHHLQKRILMGNNKFNTCALCGDELPNDLLVVAHIKKRADCNHLQRCDPNVVMLNCALGCDSLYEKGYVSVHEGKITENGKAIHSARISGYLSAIVNRDCTAFNDESRDYFEEHFQRHRTKPQA